MIDSERLDLPSASNSAFWGCAGQRNMVKRLPPEAFKRDPDPLAQRGDRIHKAMETGNTLELDEEETEIYQSGLAYVQKLVEKWTSTFGYGPQDYFEGPREERLWLHDASTLDPIASGKLDLHFMSRTETHALVIDTKTGFCSNLVGARGNSQLRLQAVLLKNEHPKLEHIRVAFAKPLFNHAQIDYCDYEEADLKHSLDSVLMHLWWSGQPDAKRTPDTHCRYCAARGGFCPQAAAYAMLPTVIASEVLIGEKPVAVVEKLEMKDLYELWESSSTVRGILEAVNDRLKKMTDAELATIDLTHGKGKERHVVTDVHGAFEHLQKLYGYEEKELWPLLDFVNGRLAARAQEKKAINKKEAAAWVKEVLAEFITKKEDEKPIVSLK